MENTINYLHVEYSYNVSPLMTEEYLVEEHGYVPNFDKYLEAFSKALPAKWKNTTRLKITDKDFTGIDTFFKNIEINVEVHRIKDDSDYGFHGGYVADDKDFIDSQKKLHSPKINLSLSTGDGSIVKRYLRYVFAHELTHAYENYRRKLEFKDSLGIAASKRPYAAVVNDFGTFRPEKIERLLRQFIYWIDPAEQNAHISAIKAEIQDKVSNSSEISNSRKAFDLIKDTESYRELKTISSFVSYLKKGKITEDEKDKILSYYLSIVPKTNLTSYNELYKWIVRVWERYKIKVKKGIAKIAYDVFASNYGSTINFKLEDPEEFWEED